MVSEESLSLSARCVILTGPTATGKTSLALEAVKRIPELEIINSDSLLFYRGMDIGTAKPSRAELARAPHHLIDIRNPNEQFSAGDFVRAVEQVLRDLANRGKRALFVGGSGFYLKALLYGLWDAPPTDLALREKLEAISQEELFQKLSKLDSEFALKIGINDRYRTIRALEMIELAQKTPTQLAHEHSGKPDERFELWVIDRDTEVLHHRIAQRTEEMLQNGLISEVEALQKNFPESRALGAVGYFEVTEYLAGHLPSGRKLREGLLGLRDEIELATRQLVKRQRTWFKSQKHRKDFKLPDDEENLLTQLVNFYER